MSESAVSALVLDASSACNWLFNEDGRAAASDKLLFDAEVVVPSLWQLELVQVLRRRERQLKSPPAETTAFIRSLDSLKVEVVPPPFGRTLTSHHALATRHRVSPYDAVYLQLALDRGLPLMTHDAKLARAARAASVALVSA